MQYLEGRLTERRTVVMKFAFGPQTVAAVYQTTNHQVPILWENTMAITPGVTTLARLVVPQVLAPGVYELQPRNGGVACYYTRGPSTAAAVVDIRATGTQDRRLWVSLGKQQCLRMVFQRPSRAVYQVTVEEQGGPLSHVELPVGQTGARILYTATRPIWVTASVAVQETAQAFADFTSNLYVTPLASPTAVLAFGKPWAIPPSGLHYLADSLPPRAIVLNQLITIQPASARASGIPVVLQELTTRFMTTNRDAFVRQHAVKLPLTLRVTGPQLSEVARLDSLTYAGRCDFVPVLALDTQMQRVAFPSGTNVNPVIQVTQELAYAYSRQATSPLIELLLTAHPPDSAAGSFVDQDGSNV